MKKYISSLLSVSSMTLLLGVGTLGVGTLNAQQDSQRPGQQPQDPSAQSQTTPQDPNGPPSSTPNTAVPSDKTDKTATDTAKTFTGTVTKSGDKYVLQDASGTTYDVDKQDAVKPFEGKKVTIHGTLDADGKMIHVQ